MGSIDFASVCFFSGVFSLLASVIWFRKKNFIESSVIGIIWFFCSYVLCSMGLFAIDKFTLFRAASLSLGLNAVILAATIFLRRDKPFSLRGLFKCDFSLKDVLIPIIICVIAVPLVLVKNELFGMGQDQGVYQIQAINFINGDYSRQKDFSEYHLLEDEDAKAEFEYYVKNALRGYDIPDERFPNSSYDRDVSPISGIIHGIPTYTAILAMWGTIFGIENMANVETVFYLLMIFMVYFICRNLKLRKTSCLAACVVSAAAPVIVWVAKSSLTEMFLTLLPALFLYFLTDDENPKQKWLSILPVAVFACYHVSIYTIIPIIFIIYAGMYFFTREKQYAILMPVTLAGYLASFFMMKQIQPTYTLNNYRFLYVGGITIHNITAIITAVCLVGIVASAVYAFILGRKSKDFSPTEFSKRAADSRLFKIFLSLLTALPILYIIIKAIGKYSSLEDASYTTLWGFICSSGAFLIIAAIIAAALMPKVFAENPSRLVVFLMFFYCVLIYSAFLRYEIDYYFYYSRYLAPFIPIAAIFAVMTLDRFGGRLVLSLSAAGLIITLPYDRFLMQSKDDTRMEWSVLEDIAEVTQSGDCIVISREYMDHLWLPLKTMTDADVYPLSPENSDEQLIWLSQNYERTLYITSETEDSDDFTVLYRNRVNCSEDDLNYVGDLVPMSYDFYESVKDISVYRFDKYDFTYTASGDYSKFSGVSALEGEFCWIDEEEAQISCGLFPADYEVTLTQGAAIPFEALGLDELEVTFSINGTEVETAVITPETVGADITFEIDEEYIDDGQNILSIQCELWDIADINPDDTRSVSIPIQSIVFTVLE